MRTEKYINERLAQMEDIDSFGTKKEIKELPNLLDDTEELIYITSGMFDNNTWLIALTDKRILFLDKGMIFGLNTKSVDLDMVNSVQFKTGLVFGEFLVVTGVERILIKNLYKKQGRLFEELTVKQLRIRKNEMYQHNIVQVDTNTSKEDDIIEKLARLGELKEKGVLDEEEFKKAKDKILN